MEIKRDNGNLQKENAPRYIVSIGNYVNEGAALTRRDAVAKAGYRAEVIDLHDDNTTTTVAALLLIAEQVKALTEKVDEITQAVKGMKNESQTETEIALEKPKTLVDIINEYKSKKGFNIRELATKTGIPRGTLSNYFSGTTQTINTKAILLIAAALDIPNDEIIKYL